MFQKKPSNNNNNNNNSNEDVEITAHKKRDISPEERQQVVNELRLVPKLGWDKGWYKGCILS